MTEAPMTEAPMTEAPMTEAERMAPAMTTAKPMTPRPRGRCLAGKPLCVLRPLLTTTKPMTARLRDTESRGLRNYRAAHGR